MDAFSYAAGKLNLACRSLMLPHTLGVPGSIADASENCDAAFDKLSGKHLDDDAAGYVTRSKELMNYSEIVDRTGQGMWLAKAATMSDDECERCPTMLMSSHRDSACVRTSICRSSKRFAVQ